MKTPEDEAFDELARKQGMWGGGFQAKRQMAADKLHWSDCAVHNAPAYPAEKCDCDVAQEPVTHLWECLGRWSAYLVENGKQADCAPPSWLVDAINKATTPAQPVQEPVAHIVQSNGKHSPLLTHMMSKRTTPPLPAQEPTGMLHIDRLGQWLDASLKERKRPWVGLTPEDILALLDEHNLYGSKLVEFARAVETKTKEQNNG